MIKSSQGYRQYRRYLYGLRGFSQRPVVRDLTFLILSLLCAAFFGFFAIKPSLQTIGGLIKEIKDKRFASEMLEKKINALTIARKEYDRLEADLPLIYAVLPFQTDFSKLAKQLEYLASQNQLAITSLQFEEVNLFEQEEKLFPIKFEMEMTGDFRRMEKFVEDLEKLERLVNFENLAFYKKKPLREQSFPLTLTIEAQGHFLP